LGDTYENFQNRNQNHHRPIVTNYQPNYPDNSNNYNYNQLNPNQSNYATKNVKSPYITNQSGVPGQQLEDRSLKTARAKAYASELESQINEKESKKNKERIDRGQINLPNLQANYYIQSPRNLANVSKNHPSFESQQNNHNSQPQIQHSSMNNNYNYGDNPSRYDDSYQLNQTVHNMIPQSQNHMKQQEINVLNVLNIEREGIDVDCSTATRVDCASIYATIIANACR
jgi:hypothetical protein